MRFVRGLEFKLWRFLNTRKFKEGLFVITLKKSKFPYGGGPCYDLSLDNLESGVDYSSYPYIGLENKAKVKEFAGNLIDEFFKKSHEQENNPAHIPEV